MLPYRPFQFIARAGRSALAVALCGVIGGGSAFAQSATGTNAPAAKPMVEFKLDDPVKWPAGQPTPRYPDSLLKAGVTGSTLAMFVVDTSGMVDVQSLKIVRTAHPLFIDAIKATLPQLKLQPARVGGRAVKQLVQVLYHFATVTRPISDSLKTVNNVLAFEVVVVGNDAAGGTAAAKAPSPPPIYFLDGKRVAREVVDKLAKERIASVDVIKGAEAMAKYGEDGRNGVVLVVTKP